MIVIGRNEEGQLTAAQQLTRQQRNQKEVTDALGNLATFAHGLGHNRGISVHDVPPLVHTVSTNSFERVLEDRGGCSRICDTNETLCI
jgi:hypothetical protein